MNTTNQSSPPIQKQNALETGTCYEACLDLIEPAAAAVFGADPRVRAVGIAPYHGGGFGFAGTRNVEAILPLGGEAAQIVRQFQGIPITYDETFGEINSLTAAPVLPSTTTQVAETQVSRPLVCGLQYRPVHPIQCSRACPWQQRRAWRRHPSAWDHRQSTAA